MSIVDKCCRPIRCHFVFFLSIIVLSGWSVFCDFVIIKDFGSLVDVIRRLSIVIAQAYFIAFIIELLNKSVYKIIVYVLIFLFFIFDLFVYFRFNTRVSPDIINLVGETNINEAREFFKTFVFSEKTVLVFIISVCAVFLVVVLEKKERVFFYLCSNKLMPIILLFVLYGVYNCKVYYRLFGCKSMDDVMLWRDSYYIKPTDSYSNLLYSVYGVYLAQKDVKHAIKETKVYLESNRVGLENSDSLDIVIIIGESYIKTHSSLYGYYLHTCPKMEKEQLAGNLFVFNDVISPYNLTSKVLKNVFSCNSISDSEKWYEKPCFPAILKRAGYNVDMWDNQKTYEAQSSFTYSLNSYLYNKELQRLSYDRTNPKSYRYDEDLVDSYKTSNSCRNIVLFHLMGQHNYAIDRYPKNRGFDCFTVDSINRHEAWMTTGKLQEIAEYDNATLYNDYIIGKIISRWKSKNSVVVYLSDHGEDVYDSGNQRGRTITDTPNKDALYYQYQIPFIIWCSDSFIDKYPQKVKAIKQSINKPFMIDNLCQMVLGIADVKCSVYIPQRDVLNDSYMCRKRLVNGILNYEMEFNK